MAYKQGVSRYVYGQLMSRTDGSPITTGTVTAYVSKDGAAAGPADDTPVHIVNGQHALLLTASELDAQTVGVAFVHTDAVPCSVSISTVTRLVSDLGTGNITVSSPVSATGNIELVRGDDYNNTDGRALEFVNESGTWPDLTGATILFSGKLNNNTISKTGSVVTATGEDQKVRVELTADDIGEQYGEHGQYDVQATLASSRVVTLQRGVLAILEDVR